MGRNNQSGLKAALPQTPEQKMEIRSMENKQFLKKKKEKEKWDQVVTEFPFGSKNALILGMVLQYSSFKGQLCQTL